MSVYDNILGIAQMSRMLIIKKHTEKLLDEFNLQHKNLECICFIGGEIRRPMMARVT